VLGLGLGASESFIAGAGDPWQSAAVYWQAIQYE